jgi:hypothetical protein
METLLCLGVWYQWCQVLRPETDEAMQGQRQVVTPDATRKSFSGIGNTLVHLEDFALIDSLQSICYFPTKSSGNVERK